MRKKTVTNTPTKPVSPPKDERPLAVDPALLDAMILAAMTEGSREETSYVGEASEGMDDSLSFEDTHIDIGLKNGRIRSDK